MTDHRRNTFVDRPLTIITRRRTEKNPKMMKEMRRKKNASVYTSTPTRHGITTPAALDYGFTAKISTGQPVAPFVAPNATHTQKSVLFSYRRFNSIRTQWTWNDLKHRCWPQLDQRNEFEKRERRSRMERKKLIEFVAAGNTFTNKWMKIAQQQVNPKYDTMECVDMGNTYLGHSLQVRTKNCDSLEGIRYGGE